MNLNTSKKAEGTAAEAVANVRATLARLLDDLPDMDPERAIRLLRIECKNIVLYLDDVLEDHRHE